MCAARVLAAENGVEPLEVAVRECSLLCRGGDRTPGATPFLVAYYGLWKRLKG
jgi:hypothetical protein